MAQTDSDRVLNPFLPMQELPEEAPVALGWDDRNEYTQTYDDDVVPSGSAREVLAWVGNDKQKAQAAFDVETAKGDHFRKGLTKDLEEILNG